MPPKTKHRKGGRKGKKHKIPSVPADAGPPLKARIEILWPEDRQWYKATVVNFSAELCQHGLLYEKGETEWVDLQPSAKERVTWRMQTAEPDSAAKPRRHKEQASDGEAASRPATPEDKSKQQWVQCERRKCGKWRKVPSHIDPDALPDKWTCDKNYWDPERASCDADEEAEENDEDDLPAVKKDSKLSYGRLRETIQANLTYRAYHPQDEPYIKSSLYCNEGNSVKSELGGAAPAGGGVDDEEARVIRRMMSKAVVTSFPLHSCMPAPAKIAKPWKTGIIPARRHR